MLLGIFVLLMLVFSFIRAFFADANYLSREVFFVFAIMIGLPLSVIYGPGAADLLFGENGLGGFQPIAGFLIIFGLILLFAYVLSSGMSQWVSSGKTAGKVILGILAVLEGMLVVGSIFYATSIFSEKMKQAIENNKASKITVAFARWIYLDLVDIDKAIHKKQKFVLPSRIQAHGGRVTLYRDSVIVKFAVPDSLGGGKMTVALHKPTVNFRIPRADTALKKHIEKPALKK